MLQSIVKLNALLEPRDRFKVLALALLMIITAFMQMAGVASVMPFLTVLSDPSVVERNAWLNFVYMAIGFESVDGFLYFLGIMAFVIFMSGTALQALTNWAITRFSHMQQYELSRRLMADYLRRPYTFFLTRNSADLAKTVLQEANRAISGVLMPAMRLLSHVLLAAAIILLLIVVEPWLSLGVAVGLGSIYGAIYLAARTWLHRIGRDQVEANRERFTAAAEAFDGAKEIRLLGREGDYLERFRDPSKRFAKNQANVSLLETIPQYAIEAIAFGGVLLLALYLMSGPGGVAQALPLIGLYGLAGKQLIPAFQKIFSTSAALRFNMPAVDNILDDLGDRAGSRPLMLRNHSVKPLALQRDITINNLTYHYPGSDKPALHNLNLSIPARTTVGFVGASGAGKSTLIDLLLGLLDPDEGDIRIDDERLTSTNIRAWQASLGYVPQQIFLADQSVAENIALGIPAGRIDHDAVRKAARLANLHDFVVKDLPYGYDTVIGERGVRLSGGQRQRIGIARALYRDPAVLLFDEATSALDNATERAVMDAIHNLSKEKTIILVAHRLSTVEPCQCIYVLSQGRVAEQGAWQELLNAGSHLQKLASGAEQ
ncbi:ABC transporter ATP-binding protein [Ectothiorhodospira lacustris]|uniref:ABC transporter ATP-binding protein n=1 Tax=Ectothiorhodospira lacustris TaxID=2899127 RepID=UPI001EE863E8|nr:ABC transporter ATP-binding protein [Ectothiorhodospira lacustris]MCG5510342.1 ABC transporter ATP-binding protein/permease [Ectothiorhodospira lacustris]MCG5522088.1 ABC transporter ATP-binding protein/permease [Ectothiorhodospira lacustris]